MKFQVSNPLFFKLLDVEAQRFNPSDYTFQGVYKIEIENKHILLRKRLKYPSIIVAKNGKEMDCPLTDESDETINVITVPARKKIALKVKVDQKKPPFTDIGEFTYHLSYCLGHSSKLHKAQLEVAEKVA